MVGISNNGGMAKITFSNDPVTTVGNLPEVGAKAPDFELVSGDLTPIKLSDYAGKRVVLNIFPSLDTGVCAKSVRTFNQKAASLDNTVVLNVSNDLPFAQQRFCAAEGIENAETGSAFRSEFGKDYGVTMQDGPLEGLLSRAVVVLDENGSVIYHQQVPEIGTEPDYDSALAVL